MAFAVNGISLTGTYRTWFAQVNNCPASLPAGASRTISVTFTPQAAATRSAKLNMATSATTTPLSVPLSGTGLYLEALLLCRRSRARTRHDCATLPRPFRSWCEPPTQSVGDKLIATTEPGGPDLAPVGPQWRCMAGVDWLGHSTRICM